MRLGCHACLFGEKIATETDFILENLAMTGFSGVEVGFRFFGEDMERLSKSLIKNKMLLSGFHCGIKFADLANDFSKSHDFLMNIGRSVSTMPDLSMPVKNVIMSADFECTPPRGKVADDSPLLDSCFLEQCAENLDKIAKDLSAEGISLNYHNHNQEFENNQKIFSALLEHTSALFFAFDLGWIHLGGGDVFETLNKCKSRIKYLHLRDPLKKEYDFAEIGKGDFDFKNVYDAVTQILNPLDWAIVEYETGSQDFNRYKQSFEFLLNLENA